MKIERSVVDLGFKFSLDIPDNWLEYPSGDAVLVLKGDLGQGSNTLAPSVVVAITAAGTFAEEVEKIVSAVEGLPESIELACSEERIDGFETLSVAYVFHNVETQATQIQIAHMTHIPQTDPVSLTVFGNCGGAASAPTLTALGDICRSARVVM